MVQTIELPVRKATVTEFSEAPSMVAKSWRDPAKHWRFRGEQAVVDRYQVQ